MHPKSFPVNHYGESNISMHPPRCRVRKLKLGAFGLATIGLLELSTFSLARGGSGGHQVGSANQGSQGNPTGNKDYYRDPFWGPWYPGNPGYYDSDYWYTPTPEQKTTAQKRVQDYFTAVRKGKRRAANRYIAVETLKPTKKQLEDYVKKREGAKSAARASGNQLSNRWVESGQLRCVMVFDTRSNQFAGSGCYVIGGLPPAGTVAKFETVSAEYVGTNAP